jgi:transcription antitermination factor NusG
MLPVAEGAKLRLTSFSARCETWSKCLSTSNFPWYVIRLRSNFEKVATSSLKDRGYETFLPLYRTRRKWSDRVKEIEAPLFPGYTFCRFDAGLKLPILQCPGVISILEAPAGPIPVPDSELAAVRLMLDSGLAFDAYPFLQQGQPVMVERGPLRGTEGLVVRIKGNYRLVISVFLLQRSVSAEIDRDSIRVLPMPSLAMSSASYA